MTESTTIAIFEEKKVRKVWYQDQRFFSVIDVIAILSESPNPRRYRSDIKRKLVQDEGFYQLYENIVQLKLISNDGKQYETDTANTTTMLRIVQSIPSPKAEPFKQRLAIVGSERIEEIENPELAQERMKQLYEQKGYPQDWIDKRLRGIAIRQNLTDEWKQRGITEKRDYAILTAEISKATFGITPSEYKKLKKIPEQSKTNLRDHMTDLELIFTMLGEKVTTEISAKEQPENFKQSKKVAYRGGKVAGNARKETEKELWKSIISDKNFLENSQQKHLPTNKK